MSNNMAEEIATKHADPAAVLTGSDVHPFQCSIFVPASSARPDVGGLFIAACGARLLSHSLQKGSIVSIWSTFETVRETRVLAICTIANHA
jgi:hypothetical protein